MKTLFHSLLLALLILPAWNALAQRPNTALIPDPNTPNLWPERWREKIARVKQGDMDLIFVGASIMEAWDHGENQGVWSAYFSPRKAVSLGFSGARTENILWMLDNGLVDGVSPKVAVVMVGANNANSVNGHIPNTPEELAAGITAIVQRLRDKLPTTKIILLRLFPRSDIPGANEVCQKAAALAAKSADNRHVFDLDLSRTFSLPDGKGGLVQNRSLFLDGLHPTPVGNLRWAEAMEPLLEKWTGRPENSAIVPSPRQEVDFYEWQPRHDAVKALIKQSPPELVFIGDSITHLFGGLPASPAARGQAVWDQYYALRHAINLGFGWDRTQQVLWRLQNGEFEGIQPKVAVLLVGTNNLTPHNARGNTDAEIVAGIRAVCETIHRKSPQTKILLLGLLPRGQNPDELLRVRIRDINAALTKEKFGGYVTFQDIGGAFLNPDGTMKPDVSVDHLHPNEAGYRLWAEAIEPTMTRLFGK